MGNFKSQDYQTKSGTSVKIRNLELGDELALYDFYAQAVQETQHTLVCQEKLASLTRLGEKIENAVKSFSEIYLGVFDDAKVIGSLQFRVTLPDHPWVKHLGEFGMIVLKQYWNQGIGKQLLKLMEVFALETGVCRIEAKVRANNDRGIALYNGAGFKVEGVREKGAFINDQFVDEYFIAKIL